MSSASAVVCREIFDENSQPSAEEISEYAQQLGIDPESESHLLPLARDGLMQALPSPWKAYYDEKLQTHYYYNHETKNTQWEHPLDNVYRELVKRSRDVSMHDDTCASVQDLPTSEEITKNLERVETKVESEDDDLSTDSDNHTDIKDNASTTLVPGIKRLTPLGRPPLAPLGRLDKKLSDLRISPLRRSAESTLSNKPKLMRNTSDRDILSRPTLERPKMLFKQHSEIIDLKMHVLTSPEDENFSPLLAAAKVDKGLPLSGKGSMFLRMNKSDLPSPDTDKSLPLESMTKSDPPRGILREKMSDVPYRKVETVAGRQRQVSSFDEDKKSVRFKLENPPEQTVSPGSNSSSEQNDGQSSIISAAPPPLPSPLIPSSPTVPTPIITSSSTTNPAILLSPLVSRPPLPPRPLSESPREVKSISGSEKESGESDSRESKSTSPRRRLLRPPAADYIKPDLFQKNFQKISDLVRPGDIETTSMYLEEPTIDKEARPRSPMIPQKNKISINLMESIESETSIDSPDKEFANLDLNDLDDSNEDHRHEQANISETKDQEKDSGKVKDIENTDRSDKTEQSDSNSKASVTSQKKQCVENVIPRIKVPNLDLSEQSKHQNSDLDNSKNVPKDDSKSTPVSVELPRTPQLRVSPTPSYVSDLRSPREFSNLWSPLSTFKPLNKAVISPQMKSSESASCLGKNLTSPRLDGVIISQGKSNSDNVVVVYQFETQENDFPKPIKSPLIPDMGTREMIERNKADERRRLELFLQKELESIRMEWASKERRMKTELQESLKEAEEKFLLQKRVRLEEQTERHRREMEEALSTGERNHHQKLQELTKDLEERYCRESEAAEKQHSENMDRQRDNYRVRLSEQRVFLEIENERALSDLREQLQASFNRERTRIIDENRATIESLREEQTSKVTELRHDYRAEVERLRGQHACHLEEVRARARRPAADLADKYRCLKHKYARLKHDVKMSIERRNKRREMSMTTGSETEKSNSHKANQSLERCKEVNETSVSAVIEPEPSRHRVNNNPTIKYNDNETSHSDSNAHKSYNVDNNNEDWKHKRESIAPSDDTSHTSAVKQRPPRRAAVAFKEPPRPRREKQKDAGATTDCQDSSDATTADDKSKDNVNGHGRRRCFTRLKSASTSRLNYSPKRGEGWSSPLESLRQQLRKLDDIEDQFPDFACQSAYSLRYPFAEIACAGSVSRAERAELEFVRHRALVEREGMRRARAALRRRRAALHEPETQEGTTSDASSESEPGDDDTGGGAGGRGGGVLRSLRALHHDVRDIWRALDHTASPESSSCQVPTTSQARVALSAPEAVPDDHSDGGVAERARGLRAWLQTAP
ncbi:centrosomal protein of 164 kDa [Achroia grisella]|uniref:centrosomal protein of 164 kDa n=1 Tax=Achroia grisella TaxID=688607 RepID=UPI0027D2331C|nr:centrosomal protein of 164 kDa [Achroia grisella]